MSVQNIVLKKKRISAMSDDLNKGKMEFVRDDQVVITKELYKSLMEDQDDVRFLHALRAAGVDNWSGYGDAQDILESWDTE